jgi:deoxyribodipyrimidine photolyase
VTAEELVAGLSDSLLERSRILGAQSSQSDGQFVLYWMRTSVRVDEHPALGTAIEISNQLGRPVFVYHALSERYPHTSDRHHTFILQAARDIQAAFAAKSIAYAFHFERTPQPCSHDMGQSHLELDGRREACFGHDDSSVSTALFLGQHFLDFELGIHYSQVQMQSGTTKINTVRICSPIKQVKDQDPKGEFIRKYVPELAEVADEHLAEPHKMPLSTQSKVGYRNGRDYPKPIVEHGVAYRTARDRIYAVRRGENARTDAKRVFQRHESRKGAACRRS